jgi:DeoR family transcriptional regulator, fructose operon transcriptional repressor
MSEETMAKIDKAARRQAILNHLDAAEEVNTDFLAEALKVSRPTIHRDLGILEREGYLKKTKNGAVKINDFLIEKDGYFSLGLKVDLDEKKAVAKKAMDFIEKGETIIIDAGTINYLVAREINKSDLSDINIITSNVITQLALVQRRDKYMRVFATGGLIKDGCASTPGDFSEHILKDMFADKVFMTTKGIDLNGNITEYDYGECIIKKRFLEKSKTRILLTQSQKFGKVGIYQVGSLEGFDLLITDSGIRGKKDFLDLIRRNQIKTVIVEV